MKRIQYSHNPIHTGAWVFLVMLLVQQPVQALTPSKEDIWKAWRERDAGSNSVEAKWTQKLIISARAVAEYTSSAATNGGGNPSDDVVTPQFPCALTIAGNKVRFESEDPNFGEGLRGDLTRSVRTFDGEIQQTFSAMRERTSRSDVGGIKEANEAKEWSLLECMPLCLAAFPSQSPHFSAPSDWWFEDENVVVDGRPCVELRSRLKGADPQLRFVRVALVDRTPPHTVRRFLELIRDTPAVQLDMHYDDEADPSWMPIAWEYSTFYRDGELLQGAQAELVSLRLSIEVPDDAFRIEFPPRTIVTDGRRDFKMFIVNTDGRFLPFTSGQGLPSGGRTTILYVFIAGLLALGGVVWWWKRSSST